MSGKAAGPVLLLLASAGLRAQTMGMATYLEFGRVIAIGRQDVTVQTTDPRGGSPVQRSFALGRDTRADLVHEGDSVEVIYTQSPGGERTLDRLIALRGAIPTIGPAPTSGPQPGHPASSATRAVVSDDVAVAAPATRTPARRTPVVRAPVVRVPVAAPVIAAAAVPAAPGHTPGHGAATVASRRSGSGHATRSRSAVAVAAPAPPPAGKAVVASSAAAPRAASGLQVPAVSAVSLGGAPAAASPVPPRAIAVRQQAPGDVCDRPADWSGTPVTMAVLDFRYPTEREEARDVTQVGGGSGTVLADQVYDALAGDPHLVLRRGDRDKLYRMDFAGAARIGRQMGVDTVLLGTFVPVETPNPDPDAPQLTTAYTLRAGVVETCTGELLYKLQSASEIRAREAADPNSFDTAFAVPIGNLLAPVLSDAPPVTASAGTVTEVRGENVTLRLTPGASLRVGDQLGIHASRMAKIPSTNTVHVFRDELIGRVTLRRISGQSGYGVFAGEPEPKAGDGAELIPE